MRGRIPTEETKTFYSWKTSSNGVLGLRAYVERHASKALNLGHSKTPLKLQADINLSYWPINNHDLALLAKSRTRGLQSLTFQHCTQFTDEGICNLINNWKLRIDKHDNLKRPFNNDISSLDLTGCFQITDVSCFKISEYLHRLNCLNLSKCDKISDKGICSIMDGCKYLERLNLSCLNLLRDEGILAIENNLVKMKLLRMIDISGCVGFSNEALLHMLEADAPNGTIHYLNLSRCTQINLGVIGLARPSNCKTLIMCNFLKIDDFIASCIGRGCRNLQNIDFSGCKEIHDFSLNYLFEGCIRLKEIKLNRCSSITDASLEGLYPPAGKYVKKIYLAECNRLTDTSMMIIASVCFNLEVLDIQGVPLISNKGIKEISAKCPGLAYINFSASILSTNLSQQSRIPKIGSSGVASLASNCKVLRVLRCDGATRINDACILAISKKCQGLEILSLKKCYQITDSTMFSIGKYCNSLTQIHLALCTKITDDGIEALCQGCHGLNTIDFSGIYLLTNIGVLALAKNCPCLKVVNLRNCYQVTDSSIIELQRHCKLLEHLDLFSVDQISNLSVQMLGQSCDMFLYGNFGGTNVTNKGLVLTADELNYSVKQTGKLILKGLYDCKKKQLQFMKYRQFLSSKQRIISRNVKRYLLRLNSSRKENNNNKQ